MCPYGGTAHGPWRVVSVSWLCSLAEHMQVYLVIQVVVQVVPQQQIDKGFLAVLIMPQD